MRVVVGVWGPAAGRLRGACARNGSDADGLVDLPAKELALSQRGLVYALPLLLLWLLFRRGRLAVGLPVA